MLQKKLARIILSIAILSISTSAFAVLPGFNVGLQLGVGTTNYDANDFDGVVSAHIKKDGFAGRVYGGYQFNCNWGAELGYTLFTNTKFKNINETNNDGKIRHQAVDLSIKGIYSFDNGLDLLGRLGAAYVWMQTNGLLEATGFRDRNFERFQPLFGLGVSYDLAPDFPIEFAYTRFQKVNGQISSNNLFTVGLSYYFG